ncbi:MAG TPA: hypothetical protein VN688_34410 [Gemmataceae bacterium]|nr:hypothetical protein [Gemmataceae bacterium]
MAMRAIPDRLTERTTEDLMSQEVLTLLQELPIQDALQALA